MTASVVPERAARIDRVLAWTLAGVLVLVVLALLVAAVVARAPALVVFASIVGAVAIRPTLAAWTMSRAPGRFVLVIDRAQVAGSSGRWGSPTWNMLHSGNWVHLVDAETERSIGWMEVPLLSAHRLEAVGAAALFGDPRRRGRAVLTGPFRPVHAVGRAFPDRFEPWARVRTQLRNPFRRLPPSPRP